MNIENHVRAAVAAMVLLGAALIGCTRTTPVDEPDPEPPAPTAAELLLGVWRNSEGSYWIDDQIVGTSHRTITITETRLIKHVANVLHDGTLDDSWVDTNGNWAASGTALTLEGYEYDEDGPYPESYETEFYLADDDTLLLVDWRDDDGHEFLRFRRVPDALPRDIVGTWTQQNIDAPDTTTITVNAEGSMLFHSDRPGRWEYRISAQWTHDAVNGLIVMSEVESVGPLDVSGLYTEGEGTPRLAYVATHVPGQIVVSGWWNEPGGYQHDENHRFGNYYHVFVRDDAP